MHWLRLLFWCLCLLEAFRISAGDSVVVFNEVMYQPADPDTIEWVEIHNQMAVDVELSNWSLDGIAFTFPTNTIIAGGAYLVIASDPIALRTRTAQTNILGPFSGRLDNAGERLDLLNHNQRVMDSVRYGIDLPWPAGASGSGFTLAKRRPTLSSASEGNWTESAERGGTPGRENFTGAITDAPISFSEVSALTSLGVRVELVNRGPEPIDLSGYEFAFSRAVGTSHPIAAGTTLSPGAFLVVTTTAGYQPMVNEKLFLFTPGRTNLVDAVGLKTRVQARDLSGNWFYPSGETFGSRNGTLRSDLVINEIMYHNVPLEATTAEFTEEIVVPMNGSWRFNQTGSAPANWFQPGFSDAGWTAGLALLAAETAALPEPIRTPLTLGPMTFYFRTEFNFTGDTNGAEFFIEHVIDDGAVFYLNGQEIYRFNMPEGAVTPSTTATPGVSDAVLVGPIAMPASNLVPGRNVLAVEVHQGSTGSSDVVFGCKVGLRKLIRPGQPYRESTENWVEIFNRGTNTIPLANWRLDGVGYTFPTNASIAPGEYLVVAQDAAAVQARHPAARVLGNFAGQLSRGSERIALIDPTENIMDEVLYFDGAPWPESPDGHGPSLELRSPDADNGNPAAWAASVGDSEWRTYSYTEVAQPDRGPTRWNEFIFGLLDAGEVLLDDFSVVENPDTTARELLKNGRFENGTTAWRFLGTHQNAEVITDPENPVNHVLRLIADGPTEHMHNHVETTLTNNVAIVNGNTYRISFRAKMIAGCNKLNTRLYFNRVAKTTPLEPRPGGGTPGQRNSVFLENTGPTMSVLRHSPVVPAANQATEITVQAIDQDGVARVDLWWGTNGTTWTSIAMDAFEGGFRGSIPGQPQARVVQFYIEATDALGAKSVYPAAGQSSRALFKVRDGQTLSSRLHNFRLIMLPAEATALHASTNVMSNGRSGLTVIYNDSEVFYDCGLHLQSSQRGRMDQTRVGFTVNFPADQLFRGVHDTITFDRSGGWSGRGGRQDEILLRHIINQAGDSPDMYNDLVRVLTPLNTHTGIAMLLMAKYGDEFIDGSVYDKDGSLFKLELVYYPTTSVSGNPELPKIPQPDEVTGQDIGNLGDDKEDYRWFLLAENRTSRDDYTGIMDVAKAFSLSGAELERRTSELMDMEQWTRVFAFKSLSGDVDTYGFGLPHNQLIYVPPQGKARALPWDMDFAWTRGATESIDVGSRLGQIIHGIPANDRLFLGHIDDILRTSYNTNYLARWATHYGSLAGQNYGGLVTWIGQRAASARGQLPAPSPFRITSLTSASVLTNATELILRGTAPYTLKRLQRDEEPAGTGFNWTAVESWEIRVPLAFGENVVEVIGYNFRNERVATNRVAVTSTNPYGRPDRDGDGMPDEWETFNGLNAAFPEGGADPDRDGMSNLAEYLAGTVPVEPNSRLTLSTERAGGDIRVSFTAKAGRAYRLQGRDGLGGPWVDLVSAAAATADRTVQHLQSGISSQTNRFYRVTLDLPAGN